MTIEEKNMLSQKIDKATSRILGNKEIEGVIKIIEEFCEKKK